MSKLKSPLFSLEAHRTLGDDITFQRRQGVDYARQKPVPEDPRSLLQLSWRHMYQKAVALWHALSASEKQDWESQARSRQMTGYAWFLSQALKPNPGLYLPLQGGTMQGIIDMDGYAIQDLLDPVNPQDADTEAARDAAIADALEDCIDSHIHAWDGANWQTLLVESPAQKNLRVRLYDGENGLDSVLNLENSVPSTVRGTFGHAVISVYDQIFHYSLPILTAQRSGDGNEGTRVLPVTIMAWDGSAFDRLRAYGTGTLKVGRAEIGLSTPRKAAAGQVKASAGQLYWLEVNPAAGNSVVELSDDLDGLSAVVYDCFHTARESHMHTFDPPMEFSTGIWLKTFTNMTSLIFGYK